MSRLHESAVVESVPHGVLVGGEWRAASDGGVFEVEDPAAEEALGAVADATEADAVAALDAACAVQDRWAGTPPRQRAEVLRRSYELLARRREDLALLMTLEMGKPLAESRAEIDYAAEFLRWFSEIAAHVTGRYGTSSAGDGRIPHIELTSRHIHRN